ncbi:hypothetical protein [Clostridium aciditolerans]|uniref:Uncharacterized protein n=1 Tax=Clostridium aciditolerans TaxID=339861 RepID=A0A934I238_9CLOT|nr:hypothetical protein [Clostridium aciditolerans]MBI6874898.1 hypothetical protein [Clostridium aciditolerans]
MDRQIKNLLIHIKLIERCDNFIDKIVKITNTAFQHTPTGQSNISSNTTMIKCLNSEDVLYIIEIKEDNEQALINIISKWEIDKYTLLNNIKSIKEISEVKLIVDNFSNKILSDNYQTIYKFENLIRICVLNELIKQYKSNFKDFLKYINHYDEKRNFLGRNINNILQRTDFDSILTYINNNNLGGNEIAQYKENIRNKENLKELKDTDIFKDLKNIIKGQKGFEDIQKYALNFRNFIAHNKIVEDDVFLKYKSGIEQINKDLIEKYISNSNFGFLELTEENIVNSTLFLIDIEINNYEDAKMFFMKLLLEYGVIPAEIRDIDRQTTINNEDDKSDNYALLVENEMYKALFYKLEETEKTYTFYMNVKNNDLKKRIANRLSSVMDFLNNNQIIYVFDFSSFKYNNALYKYFNYFENTLRAYLSIIEINKERIFTKDNGENLETKNNANSYKDIDNRDKARVFLKPNNGNSSNLINNQFFDKPTSDLKKYLVNPIDFENNSSNNIKSLINSYLNSKNESSLLKKIFTIIEWDEGLQLINNDWEFIEGYRNIVAHENIIFHDEYIEVKNKMEEVKNILINSILKLLDEFYCVKTNFEFNEKGLKLSYSGKNLNITFDDLRVEIDDCLYCKFIYFINNVSDINLYTDVIFLNDETVKNILSSSYVEGKVNRELINNVFNSNQLLIIEGKNNRYYIEKLINENMDKIEKYTENE